MSLSPYNPLAEGHVVRTAEGHWTATRSGLEHLQAVRDWMRAHGYVEFSTAIWLTPAQLRK